MESQHQEVPKGNLATAAGMEAVPISTNKLHSWYHSQASSSGSRPIAAICESLRAFQGKLQQAAENVTEPAALDRSAQTVASPCRYAGTSLLPSRETRLRHACLH